MSLVVALSCSSCALRLRGPPDAGEEVYESRKSYTLTDAETLCASCRTC